MKENEAKPKLLGIGIVIGIAIIAVAQRPGMGWVSYLIAIPLVFLWYYGVAKGGFSLIRYLWHHLANLPYKISARRHAKKMEKENTCENCGGNIWPILVYAQRRGKTGKICQHCGHEQGTPR